MNNHPISRVFLAIVLTLFLYTAGHLLHLVDLPGLQDGIAYARGGDDHGDHGDEGDDHGGDSGGGASSSGSDADSDSKGESDSGESTDSGETDSGDDAGDHGGSGGDTSDSDSGQDDSDSGEAGGHDDSGSSGEDSGDAGGHDDSGEDGDDGDHDGDEAEDDSGEDDDADVDAGDPDHHPEAAAGSTAGHDHDKDFLDTLADFFAPLFSLQEEVETPDYEPGVLLAVDLDDTGLRASRTAGLETEQVVVLEHLGVTVTRLLVPEGQAETDLRDRLLEQGYTVMLNHYYRLDGSKNRDYPYSLIGWPVACSSCGLGIKIGMIDTPVSISPPVLSGRRIIRKAFVPLDENTETGHGTAIASILVGCPGAEFCGLLPDAVLYAAGAFAGGKGTDPRATALAIVRSLDWLVAQRVPVVNMSFSGPDNALLRQGIARALATDTLLLAAAGNQGREGRPVFPAAWPGVIAVTAVDQFQRLYHQANRGDYVSFAAPGVRVPVPEQSGTIGYRSGTSYATAYCTAMAAHLLALHRGQQAGRAALVDALKQHVIDLGPPGKDPRFGWGLVYCDKSCTRR